MRRHLRRRQQNEETFKRRGEPGFHDDVSSSAPSSATRSLLPPATFWTEGDLKVQNKLID